MQKSGPKIKARKEPTIYFSNYREMIPPPSAAVVASPNRLPPSISTGGNRNDSPSKIAEG